MHKEVREFVKQVRAICPNKFFSSRVLEVGSLNINGSVRKHFIICRYTGIDLSKGPGVDKIHDMSSPIPKEWGFFDVVISCEMLEHAHAWESCLLNMYDALKPGGLLILTCAGPNRPEHGTKRTTPQDSPYTTDYYRNISKEDFTSILPPKLFNPFFIEERRNREDLVFFGFKNPILASTSPAEAILRT